MSTINYRKSVGAQLRRIIDDRRNFAGSLDGHALIMSASTHRRLARQVPALDDMTFDGFPVIIDSVSDDRVYFCQPVEQSR